MSNFSNFGILNFFLTHLFLNGQDTVNCIMFKAKSYEISISKGVREKHRVKQHTNKFSGVYENAYVTWKTYQRCVLHV